jgi:hypothetical protein
MATASSSSRHHDTLLGWCVTAESTTSRLAPAAALARMFLSCTRPRRSRDQPVSAGLFARGDGHPMIPNGALDHFGGGDQQFVARVGVQRFEVFELIREPLEPFIVLVLFIAHAADGIATSRFRKEDKRRRPVYMSRVSEPPTDPFRSCTPRRPLTTRTARRARSVGAGTSARNARCPTPSWRSRPPPVCVTQCAIAFLAKDLYTCRLGEQSDRISPGDAGVVVWSVGARELSAMSIAGRTPFGDRAAS